MHLRIEKNRLHKNKVIEIALKIAKQCDEVKHPQAHLVNVLNN